MKLYARYCTVACLACILGMHALPSWAQNAAPAAPTKAIKIISCGGTWKDGQVQEPCIMVNPKDPGKLIMFYAGMSLGGGAGCIAKARADVSDPFTWHEDAANPFLKAEPKIHPAEGGSLRMDSAIYNKARDEYWLYYTGGGPGNGINLATCPTGKDGYSEVTTAHLKRYQGNPVLSAKGQPRGDGAGAAKSDEAGVGQGAVYVENGVWYLFYSYSGHGQLLPGIRLAISTDGMHWAKVSGPDLITAAPEQRIIEWHQVYKLGDRYVLLYEGHNGGVRWGAQWATSTSLTAGWKKAPQDLVDQTKWANYSDKTMFHVATPSLYKVSDKWYLCFQAAHAAQGADYMVQRWNLWVIPCDDVVKKLLSVGPGG